MRFNFNLHSILINLEMFQGLYMLIYLTEKNLSNYAVNYRENFVHYYNNTS